MARRAWYLQTVANNPRSRNRLVAQLVHQWNCWRNRANDPLIACANLLFAEGWRMSSDWPMLPVPSGELVYGIRIAKETDPYANPRNLFFAWDSTQDARAVPIDHVYEKLGLPHEDTEEQLLAWEACFWLCFLTDEARGQALLEERRTAGNGE